MMIRPMCSFWRLLVVGLLLVAGQPFRVNGQNAAPGAAAGQNAEKVRAEWTKALQAAQRDFRSSNDRETAEFVGQVLASMNQADGMSAAAMASMIDRSGRKVRELVASGALESGATLNWAMCGVVSKPGFSSGEPARPVTKTGGVPGPDGLVLYLPFDVPDKDGVTRDASGAGNDGRVYGAKWVESGRIGGAYQFSITNLTDRIVVANSDLLNPATITLAAWIKTADRDGFWNRIMDKQWEKGYCLALGGDADTKAWRGKLVFETSGGTVASDRRFDDGQWHHVAATFDGKAIHYYVDGEKKGHPVKNPGPLKKTAWDLCIGNSVIDYAAKEFLAFDGLIDEVRIYNRALPAEKIAVLAAGTRDEAASGSGNAKSDPAARMRQLKQLFDQGLIGKEDYDRKTKEIIDAL